MALSVFKLVLSLCALAASVSAQTADQQRPTTTRRPTSAPTSAPATSATTRSNPSTTTATVPPASNDPNESFLDKFRNTIPEAIRGPLGAALLGPHNIPMERENPDMIAPPSTDNGDVPNVKWPFALSHNRIQIGGWGRQQNEEVMPVADEMAGVNMRLEAGGIRELHWHTTAEWGYMIAGSARITAVNPLGQNYIEDIYPGDIWFFPAGIPHSIQGLNDIADGAEFILVFDSGGFSEDSTFQLTDWLAHVPKEVLAKNFRTDISAFDHIPSRQLWIFANALPPPDQTVDNPNGQVPEPYSMALSKMNATQLPGGTVKVVDSSTFKISKTIAFAELTVNPGAIRELHWHPTQDEWTLFLQGEARVTLYATSARARTFNYQAGDVGYVPASFGHYVENLGNTTLKFLEIFKTDRFEDISLTQWLAVTPPELVKAHLDLSDATIAAMSKQKLIVV